MAMLQLQGVRRVRGDQCQFDQVSEAGNPIRKATGFMSNSDRLLEALNRRCFGRHGFCTRELGGCHQDCIGKVARRAAIYSDRMCEAILAGAREQLKADKRMREGEVGIHCAMDDGDDEVARVMMCAGALAEDQHLSKQCRLIMLIRSLAFGSFGVSPSPGPEILRDVEVK